MTTLNDLTTKKKNLEKELDKINKEISEIIDLPDGWKVNKHKNRIVLHGTAWDGEDNVDVTICIHLQDSEISIINDFGVESLRVNVGAMKSAIKIYDENQK